MPNSFFLCFLLRPVRGFALQYTNFIPTTSFTLLFADAVAIACKFGLEHSKRVELEGKRRKEQHHRSSSPSPIVRKRRSQSGKERLYQRAAEQKHADWDGSYIY
jgi:hypothetical protein